MKEKTRSKIIQAAYSLFAQKGIAGVSTSEIAKNAGVGAGTVFVHFATKQDLVDELFLEVTDDLAKVFEEISKNKYEDRFKEFSKNMILYFNSNYNKFLFYSGVKMEIELSGQVTKDYQRKMAPVYEFIELGIKNGQLKNLDVLLIKSLIWSTITAVINCYGKNKIEKIDPIFIDLIWDQVKNT